MSTSIVVIGNGSFAVRCVKLMHIHGFDVRLVVADPNARVLHGVLEEYCQVTGIPLRHAKRINDSQTVQAIRAVAADFLFNIYGMQLLGPELISAPRRSAINFHNGPLPRYRGVNIYSWAIINGETEHGVTWHEITPEIDGGDVLSEKNFEIKGSDTPITLTKRGFDAGVESLDPLLSDLQQGSVRRRAQDRGAATYSSHKRTPNGGRLDFSWPFDRVERLIRGLDFRPLPNTFVRATVTFRSFAFHPQTARLVDHGDRATPGLVTGIDGESIHVQLPDAVAALGELLDASGAKVSAVAIADRIGLKVGDKLD